MSDCSARPASTALRTINLRNIRFSPIGQSGPCNESSMWGDYHAMELALLIKRLANDGYHQFAG